jgi:hypothetical protein
MRSHWGRDRRSRSPGFVKCPADCHDGKELAASLPNMDFLANRNLCILYSTLEIDTHRRLLSPTAHR